MKQLLLFFTAYMMMSGSAQAIEFTYKFKVLSSGPDIYACNVGIRHPNGERCFVDDNPDQPCDDGKCFPGAPCVNRCKCLGPQGDTRVDKVEGVFGTWQDGNPTVYDSTLGVWGATSWVQQFPDSQAWNYKLGDDLTFKFTSEVYSAEYFVDICYRGPQEITFNGTDGGIYALTAATYGNDSMGRTAPNGETVRYIQLSELATKVEVHCSEQPGEFNDMFGGGSLQPLGEQRITFFDGTNIGTLLNIPRFCKVRYYFAETAGTQRWNTLQEAHMCTYTKIDEPIASGSKN